MRSIRQYSDLITRIVERSGAESAEIESTQADATNGIVDGVVYFYDGSRLEFTERVAIQQNRPVKRFYRYQYVRADEAVFRYDNAPHHPDLPTFPHHKHVGNKKLPATEPTLSQVLGEIASVLGEGTAASLPAPKRRRQLQKRKP